MLVCATCYSYLLDIASTRIIYLQISGNMQWSRKMKNIGGGQYTRCAVRCKAAIIDDLKKS